MSMTRKHFQRIADALAYVTPTHAYTEGMLNNRGIMFNSTIEEMATACASFNPSFDRARFFEAIRSGTPAAWRPAVLPFPNQIPA
jgi:hypothetical protein